MMGMFSITKITGMPPEAVTSGGHPEPSANGRLVVVTTGSTAQQPSASTRPKLSLVQD
jgi:hypothetical protein